MLATQAQFDFIKALLGQRDLDESLTTRVAIARAKAQANSLTSSEASALITSLKDAPVASLEGMHVLPTGEIYKVQRAVHGSGRLYTKRLTACPETGTASFDIERGALRLLSKATRMTKDQAARFGHTYGVCCNCGRTLTDETSIAQGYGPVCAQYFA